MHHCMPRPHLLHSVCCPATWRATHDRCHATAGSHSCPYDERREVAFRQQLDSMRQLCSARGPDAGQRAVCIVCRRGNDSQHAVRLFRQHGVPDAVDVIGGLEGWADQADVDFPVY